jgi:hypothetical protein
MKKVRFTETQIISILKQQEAGLSVKDLAREHGISEAWVAAKSVLMCSISNGASNVRKVRKFFDHFFHQYTISLNLRFRKERCGKRGVKKMRV